MPASRFLKYTGRNWPNPVCSFYLPVSTSRDDPVGEGTELWWDFSRYKVPIVVKSFTNHHPKQHMFVKINKKEETPRRRRHTCTRETKSSPFPSWKNYWTGCCWPVCDEFRLIWECEASVFQTGYTDLNSPVTLTGQSTRYDNYNHDRTVRERGRQVIQKMWRVE